MERNSLETKTDVLKISQAHTHTGTHRRKECVCLDVLACVCAYPLWIKSACLRLATRSTVGRSMSTRVHDDELTASGHNG